MNSDLAVKQIRDYFIKQSVKDDKINNPVFFVHSDTQDINLKLCWSFSDNVFSDPNQPYFLASVGKLFTSVFTGIMMEKKKLSYDDYIYHYLDNALLKGLHTYDGKDQSHEIKIKHLLNHTSGLHDYFEDKPKKGPSMMEQFLGEPDKIWHPREIISWSKENLSAHAIPGKKFHYSDTGYQLLGLILEKVSDMPLHEAYEKYIFKPLGMDDTFLYHDKSQLDQTKLPIARVYIDQLDVTEYAVLRNDYAGGGIVSTNDDLLRFMRAIKNTIIIKKTTFEAMHDWAGSLGVQFFGLNYGYGLMEVKPTPLLIPKKYQVWGNMGSIGSVMFYHPTLDTYFMGSLNQFRYTRKAIRMVFKTIDIILKNQ